MQCVFYQNGVCRRNPLASDSYKTSEKDQKDYCLTTDFNTCPRYLAFIKMK